VILTSVGVGVVPFIETSVPFAKLRVGNQDRKEPADVSNRGLAKVSGIDAMATL
jgi:hypothetical protein